MDVPEGLRRKMHVASAPLDEYADAVRVRLPRTAAETARWIAVISSLDFAQLLVLAEANCDPMPWAPLLNAIAAIRLSTDDAAAALADDHLRRLAREMLDWQGLELINPDDVVRAPPAYAGHVIAALDVIAANTTIPA